MTPRLFPLVLIATLLLSGAADVAAQSQDHRSQLAANTEPGAMYLEDILPRPLRLVVAANSMIYYQVDMQRVLGAMAAGTVVQLAAMTDTMYKVRGRARHGDVAGWMRMQDLKSNDPHLADNLKKYFERRTKVDSLIKSKQIAIGMTSAEVKASLGEPQRKSAKITAEGREETLDYVAYKMIPQVVTGRDASGNVVQSVMYTKVESGKLSVAIKGGTVVSIEETQGNPLGNGGVQVVPGPIVLN